MGPLVETARQEIVSEPRPGPGRGKVGETTEDKKKGHDVQSFGEQRLNTRLRAINRAPESVRKLYEQDKLSQVKVSWDF